MRPEQPNVGESDSGPSRDDLLQELCEVKRSALLATPFLSFETRFLEREGAELHLWATMSKSVAESTLAKQAVKIRFPWALGMWAGASKFLGFEQDVNRRFLRVSVPKNLGPDDLRQHWRSDRCGKSSGTLGNEDLKVIRIVLENLSEGGVSIFSSEPMDLEAFGPGRQSTLSLHLEGGIHLLSKVRIAHGDAFHVGLAFEPPLGEEMVAALRGLLQPRWEEANRAWLDRSDLRAQAYLAVAMAVPQGILLITASSELETQIRPLLEGLPELRVAPPVMSRLKNALNPAPLLVLVHIPQSGLEDRRRYRALVEALPDCPLVLLSTPEGTALARQIGNEAKALTLAWNTSLGAFFVRLVGGLLKKYSSSQKP